MVFSFNQFDLPEYPTFEILNEKVLYAIKETVGFGFAWDPDTARVHLMTWLRLSEGRVRQAPIEVRTIQEI